MLVGRIVGELAELVGGARADCLTESPWSRRKSTVCPSWGDVFDEGRAGPGHQGPHFPAVAAIV